MDGRDNSTEAWGPGAVFRNSMALLPPTKWEPQVGQTWGKHGKQMGKMMGTNMN